MLSSLICLVGGAGDLVGGGDCWDCGAKQASFVVISVRVPEFTVCEVMCFRGELGFLNCDDICMCVVNKQFEPLKFVLDSVCVDLQYDEISLTFTAGSVSLWCVCSHLVVFGLSVRLSWYLCGCGGCCDCDASTVVCDACVYAERV